MRPGTPPSARSVFRATIAVALAATTLSAWSCASLSGLSDGADAGRDAGRDADHVRESGVSDQSAGRQDHASRDAAADVATSDSAQDAEVDAGDADAKGFCASYSPPDGVSFECDDFDENPDATAFGSFVVGAGGSVTVQSVHRDSRPNALSASGTPSGQVLNAYVSHALSSGSTFTIQCDILVTELPDAKIGTSVLQFAFASGAKASRLAVSITSNTDGGAAMIGVAETDPTGDGGESAFSHMGTMTTLPGWSRLVFSISKTGETISDSLSLNGNVLEMNYLLAPTFVLNNNGSVDIGLEGLGGTGSRQVYIDNVVLLQK